MRKTVNIKDIIANKENPRYISDKKFNKLVQSIKDFPQMLEKRPLVVDEDMVVLGGNMRLKALQKAGIKEIPIDIAEGWTDEQKKEFIIKDNVGFGEWDFDILANEWDTEKLNEWGLDFDFKIEPEAEEDDYNEPDDLKVDVVLGDLIEIGEHRLLCGDSTDSEQVAKLMNGEKADMVFTDPPYGMNLNVNYKDIYKNAKGKTKNQIKIIGDNKQFDPTFLLSFCKEVFIWGADYFCQMIPIDGSWFVWDKKIGKGKIGNEFELCWSKQKHKKEILEIEWAGFRGIEKNDGKRIHPTQKPISLCSYFINKFSDEENIIIDLFLGSGSTIVASHQLYRKCYGMELDPKYCQVIIDRMIKLDSNLVVKINGKKYNTFVK